MALIANWVTKNWKVLSTICLQCSAAVVIHVASSTTSKAAWDTLTNMYETAGMMSRVMVLKRLQKTQISEERDMETEIQKLKKFYQQNSQKEGLMSDQEFAQNILAALLLS